MRKTVFSALVAVAVLSPAAVVTAQSADASVMAQRIGSRLKESGQLRDYRVGIKFVDGVACLTGTVTSLEQAETAIRLTRQVEGVTHVVNDLSIDGDAVKRTDFQQRGGAPEPQPFERPQAAPLYNARRPAAGNWNQSPAGPPANQMAARNMPPQQGMPQQAMQPMAGNRRPAPGQLAPRTRQPNNMNMPAPMGATRQPARQQFNPAAQQAMAQQAMARQAMAQQPMAQQAMAQQAMAQQAMAQRAMAQQAMAQQGMGGRQQRPMQAQYMGGNPGGMGPMPAAYVPGGNVRAASYDSAQMPGYAWPSYSSYPNYAALSYPQQYSPTAWPYIGPFYPYPQVPLGWRKVALEWDDGWWFLDFSDRHAAH
jgi:BON domain